MTPVIVYLKQGKLFLKEDGQPVRPIESAFARDLVNAALEVHQKHEWKTKGRGAQFTSGGMLWGMDEFDPSAVRIHITGVTRGARDGQLLYALETDRVSGLFSYDWSAGKERRLFHRELFRVRDLDRHPRLPLTACSVTFPNGTANLAVVTDDRPHLEEVTSGDSVDEAPAWILGAEKQLIFQSAGVARNEQGHTMGTSPFAIHRLDLAGGEVETLLADPKHDLLLPHMSEAGDLYFIRRPFESGPRAPSPLTYLTDVLLFPFRLLKAVIHFLNFFSLTFSKKPLITAGGPKVEGPDLSAIVLRGRIIDAKKALRDSTKETDAQPLVPKSWELVRRRADGAESVLATNVVAFDLTPGGEIIYTNGRAVFVSTNGASGAELLLQDALVESVVVVG